MGNGGLRKDVSIQVVEDIIPTYSIELKFDGGVEIAKE